jgi:hypothetical protein
VASSLGCCPAAIAGSGDDEFEDALGDLLEGGERNPLAVLEREANTPDGPLEGNRAHREGSRRSVEGNDVVGVLFVHGQDRCHDVGFGFEALAERRPQRAVDEPTGERRSVGWSALPSEERAGDLSRGIHPFLAIDGEGEEVHAGPQSASCGCGDEDLGFANLNDD